MNDTVEFSSRDLMFADGANEIPTEPLIEAARMESVQAWKPTNTLGELEVIEAYSTAIIWRMTMAANAGSLWIRIFTRNGILAKNVVAQGEICIGEVAAG